MSTLTDEQKARMRSIVEALRVQHMAAHDIWQELREEGVRSLEALDVQIAISEAIEAAREAVL